MRRALVRVLAAALAFAALPAGAAAPAPAVAAPPALRGLDERFVSGTPVETRDGPRPIEQVREGDWVLAWDEDAGELCWSRVEQTFVTPRQPIWRLTLKLPDGSAESLDCTPGHPFWADGEGWVPACHLQPGQDVATLSGPARVASVAPTGRNRTVYNFEVEGTHCYFVGTGGELVHNMCARQTTGTRVNVTSKPRSVSAALTSGQRFVGKGATEIAPGVFRSANGRRQFRMTDRDITGAHGRIGPHVHFEKLDRAGEVVKNIHTPLTDP